MIRKFINIVYSYCLFILVPLAYFSIWIDCYLKTSILLLNVIWIVSILKFENYLIPIVLLWRYLYSVFWCAYICIVIECVVSNRISGSKDMVCFRNVCSYSFFLLVIFLYSFNFGLIMCSRITNDVNLFVWGKAGDSELLEIPRGDQDSPFTTCSLWVSWDVGVPASRRPLNPFYFGPPLGGQPQFLHLAVERLLL